MSCDLGVVTGGLDERRHDFLFFLLVAGPLIFVWCVWMGFLLDWGI
jgi:hypothetical protein